MMSTQKPIPSNEQRGWQPRPQPARDPGRVTGGYQPTTSENRPVKPPPKKS